MTKMFKNMLVAKQQLAKKSHSIFLRLFGGTVSLFRTIEIRFRHDLRFLTTITLLVSISSWYFSFSDFAILLNAKMTLRVFQFRIARFYF